MTTINRPSLPEQYDMGSIVIHYTLVGDNAAHNPNDCSVQHITAYRDPSNQVIYNTVYSDYPSYIQRIGCWLGLALSQYRAAGFPDPLTRWQPIQVYVWKVKVTVNGVDEEVRGDSGGGIIDLHNEMMVTNADEDLINARVQHTCCHELFHLVENMGLFDAAGQQIVILSQGGESWTEGLAELAPDFVSGWANAWMDTWGDMIPVTIDPLPDAYTYACVLWRYVCDRFSNMSKPDVGILFGADILNELLSLAQPGADINWNTLLSWMKNHPPATVTPSKPTGKPGKFNLRTVLDYILSTIEGLIKLGNKPPDGADVYSDWLVANIVQDFHNASDGRIFGYSDHNEAPGLPHTQAMYVKESEIPIGLGVNPWCARYYAFDMSAIGSPLHLSITTTPLPGETQTKPNLQIVITDGNRVINILRSTGNLDTTIDNTYLSLPFFRTCAVKDVFLIFAAEDAGAYYSIQHNTVP